MGRTEVTCIDNGNVVGADILNKTDRVLKVALDGTKIALTMYKRSPADRLYIGQLHKLEFSSTGA